MLKECDCFKERFDLWGVEGLLNSICRELLCIAPFVDMKVVRIVEVAPRDGLQSIKHCILPTEKKLELVRRFVCCFND